MIVLITILVVFVDQLSKVLFSKFLTLNQSIPVIKNFFHLTLVHNTGIAFGMLKGNSKIILFVTMVGLILIIFSLKKEILASHSSTSKGFPSIDKLSIGFILGGAVANMLDRIRVGYVIDFLDFRIWPVFNLADSCITIGAIILLWKLIAPLKSHSR